MSDLLITILSYMGIAFVSLTIFKIASLIPKKIREYIFVLVIVAVVIGTIIAAIYGLFFADVTPSVFNSEDRYPSGPNGYGPIW